MAQSCSAYMSAQKEPGILSVLSFGGDTGGFDGLKPIERHLARGAVLFHDGDDVHHVYEIVSGTLKTSKFLIDGRRQVTAFLNEGDILALPSDMPAFFGAEAVTACTLRCYPAGQIDAAMNQAPALARHLLRRFFSEAERRVAHVMTLGCKRPAERVATFLVNMADQQAPESGGACTVRLAMSRTDIADYLGLTQETVCRVLSRFRRDGIITARRCNEITIADPDALAFAAEAGSLN